MKKLLILPTLALLACLSMAQDRGGGRFMRMGGGGGGMMLLSRKDVQKELKLTDDQVSSLDKAREDMQEKMREQFQNGGGGGAGGGRPDFEKMRPIFEKMQADMKTTVNGILKPEQQKRLKEINIQMTGNMVLLDKDTQKELGLSAEQIAKVKSLQDKQQTAGREIREKVQAGEIDRSQIRELMQKNNEIMKTELGKVLTADQSKKLTAMGGAKFTPDADEEG